MSDKLIIEARINEYTQRGDNPHIPYTADEIASDARDCESAGASVVHFHAREADGTPTMAADTYLDIMRALRAQTDALLMPTLGAGMPETSVEERTEHIRALAKDPTTTPEFAPLDLASTNLDLYDANSKQFLFDSLTYENTAATLKALAAELKQNGVAPVPVLWNISSVRLLDAFIDSGVFSSPTYCELTLTEGGMLAGHPASEAGLNAFLDFLPANCHWSVLCFGGSILPLMDTIIERGGHFAVGLGDYAYPELDYPSNAQLIDHIATRARELGRDIASPDEARAQLLSN